MSDVDRRKIYETFTLLGNKWRDGSSVSVLWAEFMDIVICAHVCCLKWVGNALTNYPQW